MFNSPQPRGIEGATASAILGTWYIGTFYYICFCLKILLDGSDSSPSVYAKKRSIGSFSSAPNNFNH